MERRPRPHSSRAHGALTLETDRAVSDVRDAGGVALQRNPERLLGRCWGLETGYLPRWRSRTDDEPANSDSDRMEDLLHVDPLELEIGFRLIGLADPNAAATCSAGSRRSPEGGARDGADRPPGADSRRDRPATPRISRQDPRDGRRPGDRLCRPAAGRAAGRAGHPPDGRDGVDPVTGQPAVWIHAEAARSPSWPAAGCWRTAAVVAGHFGEIVANHADELLTREQVERLLDRVRSTAPTLVGEVVPGLLRAGELQRVLQNLLRERVSIRDLETILETLAVHAGKTKDIDLLTEQVRRSLAPADHRELSGPDGRLRVVTLSRPLDAGCAAASQAETRPAEALGEDMSGASSAPSPWRSVRWSKRISAGHSHLGRRPRRPQGPDPGRLAAAGRLQSARNSPRYADRSPGKSGRGGARGRDNLHDHGGSYERDWSMAPSECRCQSS